LSFEKIKPFYLFKRFLPKTMEESTIQSSTADILSMEDIAIDEQGKRTIKT
jgi:hypothetical protein